MTNRSEVPERIEWAVRQLPLRATDRVLEIGCGSGLALALLAKRVRAGTVTGIDRSALQVQRAIAYNQEAVDARRVRVACLALEDAATELRSEFACALAINVNAFWTAPETSFVAVARLLLPKGRLVLVYEPPSPAKVRQLTARLPLLVEQNGFVVDEVRTLPFATNHGVCVVGRR